MKKILSLSLMILIILSLFSSVFASDLKTELQIVKKSSDTKYLENDQGYISKTIVDSNKDTGEVTVELKLSNTKQNANTGSINKTQVIMVIDSSGSMYDYKNEEGVSRKKIIVKAAKTLGEKILDNMENVEVGALIFHDKAEMLTSATSNKNEFITALENWRNKTVRGWTNIDAGITLASKSYDDVKNKIMVVLTDGVPTRDEKGNGSLDVGSDKCKTIATNTREKIEDIRALGIYMIALMTGTETSDLPEEQVIQETELLKEVFGTESNSTVDKYYNISDNNINKIVTEDIYEDVEREIVQNPINTVKIVDYFPSDIMDNFEFSYVDMPNRGTISDSIDTETNSITWDIGTLKGNKAARLKYKLKIKDMNNTKLLNKTIKTNDKVVLTYQDKDLKDYKVTLSDSPKIKLAEIKQKENKKDNKKDNTTATGKIPYTGASYIIIFAIALILIVGIIAKVKYNDLKGIK